MGLIKGRGKTPPDIEDKGIGKDETNKFGNINQGTQAPSFFFKSGVTEKNYKGTFMYDDITKKEVILHINEVANLKYGKWYEMKT